MACSPYSLPFSLMIRWLSWFNSLGLLVPSKTSSCIRFSGGRRKSIVSCDAKCCTRTAKRSCSCGYGLKLMKTPLGYSRILRDFWTFWNSSFARDVPAQGIKTHMAFMFWGNTQAWIHPWTGSVCCGSHRNSAKKAWTWKYGLQCCTTPNML